MAGSLKTIAYDFFEVQGIGQFPDPLWIVKESSQESLPFTIEIVEFAT